MSRGRISQSRPSDYKSLALLLSYPGVLDIISKKTVLRKKDLGELPGYFQVGGLPIAPKGN